MENRGTQEWTAVQVSSRAELGLPEICAEWEQLAPKFEQLVHDSGFELARPCFDIWTHEQGHRRCADGTGDRNDPAIPTIVARLLAILRQGWAAHPDRPAIEFVVDGHPHGYGEGENELTLTTSGYEFARMIMSRRSQSQMLAAGWTGENPERVLPMLCMFPKPEQHLAD